MTLSRIPAAENYQPVGSGFPVITGTTTSYFVVSGQRAWSTQRKATFSAALNRATLQTMSTFGPQVRRQQFSAITSNIDSSKEARPLVGVRAGVCGERTAQRR